MTRSPDLLAYLIQGLRARASQLLARAASRCNPLPVPAMMSMCSTAYRALARASQLRADLLQRLALITPMCEAATQAATYALVASSYAHSADLRGA